MALLLCMSATVWGQARPDAPVTSPPLERIVPMEAVVNGEKTGTWPFVERLGVLYASRDALDEWRVKVQAPVETIMVRGTEYWPLNAIPGFTIKVNFSALSVEINFAAEAFVATKVSTQASARPKASPVLPSAFFNYELNYANSRSGGLTSSDFGALVEAGASTSWGVLTSSYVGRNLAGTSKDTASWTRLETTFTRHMPETNHTLRIGDSATRVGLWGRGVYFGGVQFGTNYSLTPGFLTQPLPVVAGVSAAPSTVELYVNDVLRQVSQVPAGPFAIDNTNILTGSGEARMVVRDILGREVVITQPFFTSVQLLSKGLTDWGAEIGTLRRDLGTASGRYGPPLSSGTWRYGVNDKLTVEARAEVTRDTQTAWLGLVTALPGAVLARGAAVASRNDQAGSGHHWVLGLERQWLRTSAYFQAEGANQTFRALGVGTVTPPTKLQWAANVTQAIGKAGSAGLAVASVHRYDAPTLTTVSANYSMRVGDNATVMFSVSRAFGASAGNGSSAGVTVQIPLERNRQVTATALGHGGTNDIYLTASQTSGGDSDLGWRVLAGQVAGEKHYEGGLYYLGRYGRVYSDVSNSGSQSSVRVGATGGLVFADSHVFATRRVDQSFAVVEIKDHADIGVGIGANMLTRTNARGIALLPELGAHQPNQVRLDPKDLPVSAEVESIEKIVVPAWRSAVKVDFPVRAGRAALLKINFEDGEPAPAGALVHIEGDKQEFYVARRGEAFVTGLMPANRILLEWQKQQCSFTVAMPPSTKDEIPRVGPVLCKGVKR